jgi:hypothetical protein
MARPGARPDIAWITHLRLNDMPKAASPPLTAFAIEVIAHRRHEWPLAPPPLATTACWAIA